MPDIFTPAPIILTGDCINRVLQLTQEEQDNVALRIFVTGGGCSGFQYGFSFDSEVVEDDTLVEREGAKIVVDSLSIQYLKGSTIDYQKDLTGAKFSVINPQAKSTCSCGASFSV